MTIDKFFKGEGLELDWDFLMTLPEIQAMDKAPQSPKWHKEGSVLSHTQLCISKAYELVGEFPIERARYLMAAVLLHDVGKPNVAFFKKGGWHHYGHEEESYRIIKEMLADDPYCDTIALLAKFHMKMHKLLEQKDFLEELVRMGREVNLIDLKIVHYCDCCGAICENPKDKEADTERCRTVCRIIDCTDWLSLIGSIPDKYIFRKKNG